MTEFHEAPETGHDVVPFSLLTKIHERAAEYDRTNSFFFEDLDDLVAAGYLKAFVPKEDGGLGLNLQQVSRLQRRLAGAAPATALGVNMHLVWTGVAHALAARGDQSHDFVLDEAARGEIFSFGISEAGNDSVLFDSSTRAVRQDDGGYRFYGTKIFTSLGPVWTRMGVFGRDDSDPDNPLLVFGFVRREDGGTSMKDDWDTVGMRATQSNSTVLEGAYSPPEWITRKIPVGPNADSLTFAIFANFLLLVPSVYAGIAGRALELAVQSAKSRRSKSLGVPHAEIPAVRSRIADAAMEYEALPMQLDAVTRAVDELQELGADWFTRLVGTKIRVTEGAINVVEAAMQVSGGAGFYNSAEISRLWRDVQAGTYHPSNMDSARNTFANRYLGPLQ